MFKVGFAVILAVAIGSSAVAQTVAPPKNLATPGKLSYAVAGSFAPFAFSRDGELVGVDIDLGADLARQMGLEPSPLNVEFKGAIPALLGGRVDIINAAMYITDERAKQVDFIPYMRIGTEVVVAKANPTKITGRDNSLCGKRIAVTLGGIQEKYARQDDACCKEAGLEGVVVLTFPTAQDSLLAVRQGRADGLFDSIPGAVKAMTELPEVYTSVGDTFEANTRLGYGIRKGDENMRQAIEAALKAVIGSGQYKAVVEKWNLPSTMSIFN
jgi:polar amino acid transport system substrate-binding protein